MSSIRDPRLREVKEYIESEYDKSKYDPLQDQEERRELRKSYRDLYETTHRNQRQLAVSESAEGLSSTLDKTNNLYGKVKNVQEATLDSKLLVLSADINVQKSKSIKLGTTEDFNTDEFVSKVISDGRQEDNDEDRLDWGKIGKTAFTFTKAVPSMDFLLGPLATEKKVSKRTKTLRLHLNKDDLIKPAQLQQEEINQQENETTTNVNAIYNILTRVSPINYFKFITNPKSFSQTVENMFYLSFLVNKAVVRMDIVDKQPVLSVAAPPNVDSKENLLNRCQVVMGMDMSDWEDVIDAYKIQESVIPHRERKDITPAFT